MDLSVLYAICALAVTVTVAIVGVSVVRTLRQARSSLERLERTAEQLEPVVRDLQVTLTEVRQITAQLSDGAGSVRRIASRVEAVSNKALDAGSFLLGAGGGTVGRAVAIFQAVRAGARFFFQRSRADDASPNGSPQAGDGSPGISTTSRTEEKERAHVQ